MNGHLPALIDGLWCATLTPSTAAGAHRPRALRRARACAVRARRGRHRAVRHHRRRPVVLGRRAARRVSKRCWQPGIPAARIVAGTGCASLPETIALTRHATSAGCTACLVLPPFFWKDAERRRPVRVVRAADRGRRRPAPAHLPLPPAAGVRRCRCRSTSSRGSPRRFRASSPASRTAKATGTHTSGAARARAAAHDRHRPRAAPAAADARGRRRHHLRRGQRLPGARARAAVARRRRADDEARIAKFIEIAFRQPFLAGFKSMVGRPDGDPGWRNVRAPLVPLDRRPAPRAARRARRAPAFRVSRQGDHAMSIAHAHAGRPRRARRVRHADDLQRAGAPRPASCRAGGYTTRAVRLRLPGAEAHRRLRAHGDDPLGAAAGRMPPRTSARLHERLLPLHRRGPAAVDRRDPGPRRRARRLRRVLGRSAVGDPRRARRARRSSPTARCATSTSGRPASSSSPRRVAPRTRTRSRSRSACEVHGVRHARAPGRPRPRRPARRGRRAACGWRAPCPTRRARSPRARRASSPSRAAPGCTAEKLIDVFRQLDDIH